MKHRLFLLLLMAVAFLGSAACGQHNETSLEESNLYDMSVEIMQEVTENASVSEHADETYIYCVDELNMELEIPAQLYVYRTHGLRWDWKREWLRLPVCDLLVISDKQYNERFWEQITIEGAKSEAEHIVFAFTMTPKNMIPFTRMCESLFVEEEIRVSEEWYCEILKPYCLHLDDYYSYQVPFEARITNHYNAWIEEWRQSIIEKTKSVNSLSMEGEHLLSLTIEEPGIKHTFLNEVWWDAYCESVKELLTNSEAYRYESTVVEQNIEKVNAIYTSKYGRFMRNDFDDQIIGVYVDENEDIFLRAYYYACGIANCEGTDVLPSELEDIMIVFQDWDQSQRSYTAFCKDILIDSCSDYMVDLEYAYNYYADNLLR